MIANQGIITICHKGIDPQTRLETWTKYYYNDCWWFEVDGSATHDGYQYSNRVEVRIPYQTNEDAQISNISIRRYTL